jgi:hypothetical protein
MTIVLDNYVIPEKGPVELSVSFEIKVTALEAKRKVSRWLYENISMLIDADVPTLVVGERVVWRVPAYLSFPDIGRAGDVGTVDVDVMTGKMNNTPERKAAIEHCAEEVALRQPPYKPKSEVPPAFIPKDVPAVPQLSSCRYRAR